MKQGTWKQKHVVMLIEQDPKQKEGQLWGIVLRLLETWFRGGAKNKWQLQG